MRAQGTRPRRRQRASETGRPSARGSGPGEGGFPSGGAAGGPVPETAPSPAAPTLLNRLPTLRSDDEIHHVVETPKGSRNKYGDEPDLGACLLKKVLPEGLSFPYDFGMIRSTKGEVGDPVDVLLLLDAPAVTGCVAAGRVRGSIVAGARPASRRAPAAGWEPFGVDTGPWLRCVISFG